MLIDKNDASKEIKEAIEERIKSEFDAVTTPGEDWSKTDFGMGVSSGVLKRVADGGCKMISVNWQEEKEKLFIQVQIVS